MSDQGEASGVEKGATKEGRVRYVVCAVVDVDFMGEPRDDVASHFTEALQEAAKGYLRRSVTATTLVHVTVGRALK